MTIYWANFTPWSTLAGGILIGLATAMFLLINCRIAVISGILGGLLRSAKSDIGCRAAFVAGLIISPIVFSVAAPLPAVKIDADAASLIIAGLLVEIGTRYGSGCTSGHGVCGLSRRSPRSMLATALFMVAGFVAVFITHHLMS